MQVSGIIAAWMWTVMAVRVACHGDGDEDSESRDSRRKTISHHESAAEQQQQPPPEQQGSYTKMDVLMRGAIPQQVSDSYLDNRMLISAAV